MVSSAARAFGDGLSGGPLAALYNSPIIIAHSGRYDHAIAIAKQVGARRVITVGGKVWITDEMGLAAAMW